MQQSIRLCLLGTFGLVFLAGCGSTASLRQGQEISATGTAYVTAVQTVADLTIDKVIERSTEGLTKERTRMWGKVGADQLVSEVDEERRVLALEIHEISIFKAHATRLGSYFDALGKLVAEPAKDGYVDATKGLAASVNSLGTALVATNIVTSAHVTAAQQTGLGNLAGAIGDWYHAKSVHEVLNRDAQTIALQIEIEGRALETFARIVASIETLEGEAFYRAHVRDPFVTGYPKSDAGGAKQPEPPALPDSWKTDFATVIKAGDLTSQIEAARKAAKDFANAWDDFTKGKWTTTDIVGDLTRINGALAATQAVHENRH